VIRREDRESGRDRGGRASELYHAALERPAGERDAFLLDACGGDEELRAEVVSLLAYKDEPTGFMERPTTPADLTGRSIGPYRVISPIGAGGMGIVYRARDTKLGRDVALKVLPPHWASDRDRRARLDREARALAALNHPNVGAI
jgi:serine/threonine protein kinase